MLGLPFSIMPSRVNEAPVPGKNPREHAEDVAVRKVSEIKKVLEGRMPPWILGADTVISMDGLVYGKPEDREFAEKMLRTLSGREHEVVTAMALYNGREKKILTRSCVSAVRFAEMNDNEIEWYLATGEWQGVAGAYRIQGLASCFITEIRGSYSSIVGLPLREFYVMLRENGYPYGDV